MNGMNLRRATSPLLPPTHRWTRRASIYRDIEHLQRVVRNLKDRWPDTSSDEIAAAWLHDAIEDTGATPESLLAAGVSPAWRQTPIFRRCASVWRTTRTIVTPRVLRQCRGPPIW